MIESTVTLGSREEVSQFSLYVEIMAMGMYMGLDGGKTWNTWLGLPFDLRNRYREAADKIVSSIPGLDRLEQPTPDYTLHYKAMPAPIDHAPIEPPDPNRPR